MAHKRLFVLNAEEVRWSYGCAPLSYQAVPEETRD